MAKSSFQIYAPINNFQCTEDSFRLTANLWIKYFADTPDVSGLEEFLSKQEWDEARRTQYWLTYEWAEGDDPEPDEVVHLFLLSLWLVKSTKTHIVLRFHINQNPAQNQNGVHRLLDRFSWLQGQIQFGFDKAELELASEFLKKLIEIYRSKKRLNDAMLLTISGCWSHYWQTILICHAAAIEGILTYSKGPGLTSRLAEAYGLLTDEGQIEDFKSAYNFRSDVIHGRAHTINLDDRIPRLAHLQSILRRLWQIAFVSSELRAVLEESDAEREKYFQSIAED